MRVRGIVFAASVAIGMVAEDTVLPLDRDAARRACGVAVAVAAGWQRVWPAVGASLGLLRAAVAREEHEERALVRAARYDGVFDVETEAGAGRIVRIGARRILVSEPPAGFPAPGERGRALLRLDPVRSRAEPSAFRAEVWARAKGLHGRGRVLTEVRGPEPTPGWEGVLQRAGWRLRESARTRLGAGSSPGADLSAALLLGDRHLLEEDVRRGFRHAGLAHVLALSGAHLAVLALGLATLLRTCRAPRALTGMLTLVFVTTYTALTGAGAPLVRACATVGLATIADLLGRRSASLGALGWAGGGLLLLFPAWLGDVGFRLSFAATAVLVLYASAARPPAPPGWRGRLHAGGTALALSALVTLGTVPELASSFGQVSVLAPFTNLAAGPPSAASLGWGGLAAFAPMPGLARQALASAAERSSAALLFVVEHAGTWPGGDLPFPALPAPALAGIALLTIRGARGGRPGRFERAMLVAAACGTTAALLPRERMTVLDIGQGDSVLLESGGRAVLLDAGPPGRDGFESAAAPAVRRRRVRPLEAFVVSHGHLDHIGGAAEVLAQRGFRALVVRPDDGHKPEALLALEADARARGVDVRAAVPPVDLLRGTLRVQAPFGNAPPAHADENDRSLAARWQAPAFAADLFGDGARPAQDALRAIGALRPASVVLLPHHGSRENTDDELLAAVRPALAIISCGTGNTYGHPHAEVLARVRRAGCGLLRTDVDGTVTLTATRRGYRLHWVRDWPGPRALFPSFARSAAVG